MIVNNLMDAIQSFDIDEVYWGFREEQGELNDKEDELRKQLADVAIRRAEMKHEARAIFDSIIAKIALTSKADRGSSYKVKLIVLYRMFNGVGNLGDDKMAVEEILEAYGIKY